MEVDLKIKEIELPGAIYDLLTLNYGNVEINFKDRVILIFPKFHDTILGETKILLMKNSFPWALCVGVVVLSNSFFRNGEESVEYPAQILHSRYSNKANSYDFQKKEVVGNIRYEFSRKFYQEDKTQPGHDNSGFVQKMFGFFLSDEKAGIMLNVKKLMDYINSGSHSCRLNILFGGILVEKCMAEMNELFTKNIDLVLEVDNKDPPEIFRSSSNYEELVVARMNEHEISLEQRQLLVLKVRNFKLKSVKKAKSFSVLESRNHTISKLMQIPEILSSDGYRICSLGVLLRIKQLFYFTMGSYANSWPSMFIRSQKRVSEAIPSYRRAVLEILGIENEDLLFICLEPSEIVQHVVFYDRSDKRIVVSFKGTTNSEETIEDINCEYTQFCDGFVHNGFKKLSGLFISKRIGDIEKLLKKFKVNKLLLAGHSLGGAISILVNIMLREMNLLKDVSIETVAFSSPPIVSENIARKFRDGITVINYGNDVIPRMSYGSILDLKFLCCSIGEIHGPLDFSEKVWEEIETVLLHLKTVDIYPKLYFPGELIHIKRVRCSLNSNINPLVVFKVVDLKFFEQIVLIKHAPKHHSVGHMAAVLDEGIELFEQKLREGQSFP